MQVSVIGTGYVGLVVGCGLADSGNRVICVDVDATKIERLRRGEVPIYEPGLGPMMERNVKHGRLRFSTDLAAAVRDTQIVFVAVGTPPNEDGSADLHHVMDVARGVARAMDGYRLVVVKSTVPIGTCDQVRAVITGLTPHPVDVASNPEFLKEGAAVADFLKPDRIILGVASERARKTLEELYSPFVRTGSPVLTMDVRSAEMAKYAANAMLATRISLMNELANLAERVGADIAMVRRGIGSDPRIGSKFLFPGVGYGGSCFPKDVRALIRKGAEAGIGLRILQAVHDVNEAQKSVLLGKVVGHFGEDLTGLRFAIWGLAFKPHTDDVREAPAGVIIDGLLARGGTVFAYDPAAADAMRARFGDRLSVVADSYDVAVDADALLVVTEWPEFRMPDFERLATVMRRAVLFDGRNLYDPARVREMGFTYFAIGRP